MAEIVLELTQDGSHTLFVPSMNEHYHSVNGAIQESKHVFIDTGLKNVSKREVSILEVGFGTGLNAYLTLLYAKENNLKVNFMSFELYPLSEKLVESLNYDQLLSGGKDDLFTKLHNAEWNKEVEITPSFRLNKINTDFSLLEHDKSTKFDIVYYDAFAPEKQTEMWNQTIFDYLYEQTSIGGIIVTYCAKGVVRRMMQQAGYTTERLPGPPGKREMLRGIKKNN